MDVFPANFPMPKRALLLRDVARRILKLPERAVLRVGIDGVDGAGKTTFADELAELLRLSGRPIIRATADAFHNCKAIRYERGRSSPEGFFYDSYNYAALRQYLLDPLSPGGSAQYRAAAFDLSSDTPIVVPAQSAPFNSIFIFDGIFLHRMELKGYWDFSVFLDVAFEISIPRGASRGIGSPDPKAPRNRRYIEGQKLYFRLCKPRKHATLTIDNNDLAAPRIVRSSS